jgi:hypothetical protein
MGSEAKMRDLPMLDSDRELFRAEMPGFDDMTLAEFQEAARLKIEEMNDLAEKLKEV